MMKRCLSLMMALMMMMCILPVTTAFAAKEMFTTLSSVGATDVSVPVAGGKPDMSVSPAESNKYKVAKVVWSEYDEDFVFERDLGANDTFKAGYNYFVFVTLEATGSYTFGSSITATVNGNTANKYSPTEEGKKIQIYYCFGICKNNINKVNLTVVNPVVGKTPTFARVDTAEYKSENTSGVSNQTNGVTWTNQSSGVNLTISNPFKADTKYRLTYYLTAKDNYQFNGTTFYINGKQATVQSISTDKTKAVITLSDLVPGDGKREISTLNLSVTAPKDGAKPSYDKISGTGYFSDNGLHGSSTKIYKNGIAWFKSASSYISPGTTETFKGGSEYTVKITLSPQDGYKFAKNVTVKINGKTATVETFDDGSILASVKLTALQKDHKHTDSDWKQDASGHWKVCTDASCGTMTVTKAGHSDANKDSKCDVCGFAISKETVTVDASSDKQTVDTTNTDVTDVDVEEEETTAATTGDAAQEENGNGALVWIIVGVVVLAAGVAGFFFFKNKKKDVKKDAE